MCCDVLCCAVLWCGVVCMQGEIITLSPDIPRNLHSLASALRNIARDSTSPASPEEVGDASMELQSMTVEQFSWFVVEHQQPAVAVLCVEGALETHITPHPHTITPHPHTITLHPHTITPHPHTITPHPHTITPHPHTITPHPHTITPCCLSFRPHRVLPAERVHPGPGSQFARECC